MLRHCNAHVFVMEKFIKTVRFQYNNNTVLLI